MMLSILFTVDERLLGFILRSQFFLLYINNLQKLSFMAWKLRW